MRDELLALLPEATVGVVQGIEPIGEGLSGAGVYAVTTSRGDYVLRVQDQGLAGDSFAQQLRVQRRAADAGIAPMLVHVDEAARVVVSTRIFGTAVSGALASPSDRARVLGSVVEQLRCLHALDTTDVAQHEPVVYAQSAWAKQRMRPGFPAWASELGASFDAIAQVLAADPRRTLSHNDMNPGNVLWDGQRAWLIDWEACGVGHPYLDLATLALFLRLDEATLLALAAAHDGAPLSHTSRASLRASFKLAGLLCGLAFIELVQDLSFGAAATLAEVPSLAACYEGLHIGRTPLHSQAGQLAFGQALLALGVSSVT